MPDIVRHWVACLTTSGKRVVYGPFDTEDQAVEFWADLIVLDLPTARVIPAKDENEAKDWL